MLSFMFGYHAHTTTVNGKKQTNPANFCPFKAMTKRRRLAIRHRWMLKLKIAWHCRQGKIELENTYGVWL